MDNRQVEVVSEGKAALALAVQLIWPNAPGGKASHYREVKLKPKTTYYGDPRNPDAGTTHHSTSLAEDPKGCPTLILLWHGERGSQPLPYPLGFEQAVEFVHGWLGATDYGSEPDHDGSNGRGWRIFCDHWGHVAGHSSAVLGCQPAWAMYGK